METTTNPFNKSPNQIPKTSTTNPFNNNNVSNYIVNIPGLNNNEEVTQSNVIQVPSEIVQPPNEEQPEEEQLEDEDELEEEELEDEDELEDELPEEEALEEGDEEPEEEELEEGDEEPEDEQLEEEDEQLEEEENNNSLLNNELNNASIATANFEALTDKEILSLWDTTLDFLERDVIIDELRRRKLFPSDAIKEWEDETGAYPDTRDPEFLQKLLAKREFAESLQSTWKPRGDPCDDDGTFEVTPVQRFVSNFMSPKTPYMSALLFHGVGVGKTCAAIQIAEAWLSEFPRKEVLIVAPPTIQQGFYRTIFDVSRVKIGQDNEPNTTTQCTGDIYMRLSNTLFERDPERIQKLVNKQIRRRYKLFGYISFANYIKTALKGIPYAASDEQKEQLKKEKIRGQFSGRLLLIDEAHNLRDLAEEVADEQPQTPGGKAEKSDAEGGKQLTPYLRDVLRFSEGLKYVMLTATPMYNTYKEIIFVLNLLLLNDKKATITESDVFDVTGNITEKGIRLLSYISQRYVSFMRGENPISFPVRLFPQGIPKLTSYPSKSPSGTEINEQSKSYYNHLPIVPITLQGDILQATTAFMRVLPPGKGLSTFVVNNLINAGNFIVPAKTSGADINELDSNNEEVSTITTSLEDLKLRTNNECLWTVFNKESSGGEMRVRAKKEGGARWLGEDQLANYSPKYAFLINKARTCDGVLFAYTRFVNTGAFALALALEANGYSPYGRKSGFLANGIQTPGGRQCALCPERERNHPANSGHTFTPAYYGILTGDKQISPKNEETIRAQRALNNADGSKMKIIIGSQIASEGVDLRFVRETHVIDGWFHLNKTEQILGRAIRYLSHCALPKEKRNNTVYLYAGVIPPENPLGKRETVDLYSYRYGFSKAVLVGNVTRIMKQAAIDCNLNNKAIVIQGQEPIKQIDSQRRVRDNVNINDMPFTAVCDWIETCEYECKPQFDVKSLKIDDSTYDEFAARWRVAKLKERIKALFAEQVFYRTEDMWNMMADIPRMVVVDLLTEIIDNKNFMVVNNGISGYIRYCNGYYLFQPSVYLDPTIPLSIRMSRFPVKRDVYTPITYELPEIIEDDETVKVNTTQTIEVVWSSIMKWCENLSNSNVYINQPDELNQRLESLYGDNIELLEKYKQVLEMVKWFYTSFIKANMRNIDAFRLALIQYFWDNWITLDEKKFLIYNTSLNLLECIQDDQYNLGRLVINRLLDPTNGELIYMCEGGEVCKKSVIDEILRDKAEEIKSFNVNIETTGEMYGFSVPKNGDIVFKTGEPPVIGKKVGRGKECANVSTMTGHIKQLIEIGDILRNSGMGDYELRRDVLISSRPIRNATRACSLLEMFIRYIDLQELRGLRWYFRPVAAYYTGHKGFFRSDKK